MNNNETPTTEPTLRDFVLECAQDNDFGDATLFANLYRGIYLFDQSADPVCAWYCWSGNYWRAGSQAEARVQIMTNVAEIYERVRLEMEAKLPASSDDETKQEKKDRLQLEAQVKSLKKKKDKCKSRGGSDQILAAATGIQGMFTSGSEWDLNPYLFAVENCVIDLTPGAAERVRKGLPGDMIRTIAKVKYDPAATSPVFDAFLADLFDGQPHQGEIVEFLLRYFGSALTGVVHKLFPIFYGDKGDNGKTTLLEVLGGIMGDHAIPVEKSLLMKASFQASSGSANAQMASLAGKRLLWAAESKPNEEIDAAVIKVLTGGDSISTRAPFGRKQIEFKPTHKMVLLTNHKPKISSGDNAMWNRVCLVPFLNAYVDNPVEAHQKLIDRKLEKKLEAEASGILNTLIKGCVDWQTRGNLGVPECLKAVTKEYRDEQNVITQWIEDRGHIISPKVKADAGLTYADYRTWAINNGERNPMTMKTFGDGLEKNGIHKTRASRGYVWVCPEPRNLGQQIC